MRKDDDFARRLHPESSRRPEGISLFRAHAVPALRRQQRAGAMEVISPPVLASEPVHSPEKVWESLNPVRLDAAALARNGLFPEVAQNPVTAQFDILRTRLLQVLAERGWKRIAVTSPTHGCGKSVIAANLALALARVPSARTVLLDLELRQPDLARIMQVQSGPLSEVLSAEQPLEAHLRRVGGNLALALNNGAVPNPAETLLSPTTTATLDAITRHLDPSVVIADLPPALGSDDVISVLPQFDAVLLVVDGTSTTADDIRACERLFEGRTALLGVVLNRGEDFSRRRYLYRKKSL